MTAVIEGVRGATSREAATPETVRALVRACSPESLRARFALPVAPDPDRVFTRYRRYLLAGPPSGVATVATTGGLPVGLLNLVVVADGLVEAALLVADPWQRRGVGTGLLAAELTRPRWAGWTVLADVRASNEPARRLLERQGWGVRRRVAGDGDDLVYEIAVAASAAPHARCTRQSTRSR